MKHALYTSNEQFINNWEATVCFLKSQLEALCRQANSHAPAVKIKECNERAQNIRRVLVDMGEMDRSVL